MVADVLSKVFKINLEPFLPSVLFGFNLPAPADQTGNADRKPRGSLRKCQPFALFNRKNMTSKRYRVGHTQI